MLAEEFDDFGVAFFLGILIIILLMFRCAPGNQGPGKTGSESTHEGGGLEVGQVIMLAALSSRMFSLVNAMAPATS